MGVFQKHHFFERDYAFFVYLLHPNTNTMRRFTKVLAFFMLIMALFFAAGCTPENNDADVKVTTYTPQDITQTTAVCGGDVIVTQGLTLNELGVCWGTSRNPIVEDSHLSTSNWSEPYVCTITGLEPGTKYHVRAYALHGLEYYYGEDKSFTTTIPSSHIIAATAIPADGGTIAGGGTYEQGQTCTLTAAANSGYTFANWKENGTIVSTNATYTFTVTGDRTLVASFTAYGGGDGHAYVDLGLPSGTLWATCNVGATTPEGYGDYFAWGETQPKDYYDWSTYKYCNGDPVQLTKYCSFSFYGYNGFTDDLTVLQPSDDAATANWGSDWRMPTVAEWEELYHNTDVTWTTQNGVYGGLFLASNGQSLFLPAAGYRWRDELYDVGKYGDYRSSLLYLDIPYYAWYFGVRSDRYGMYYYYRHVGQSVRAVRSVRQN